MANNWDELTRNTFNFFIGSANFITEETEKALHDISNRTQTFIDEMIERGEIEFEEEKREDLKGKFLEEEGEFLEEESFNKEEFKPESFQQENIKKESAEGDRLSTWLKNKLLIRVNGDRALAKRLLETARQKNPGESYDWYYEKVIYDLERDRR